MTDEEIEKALREADDLAIDGDVDCCDVLDYINRLKDEIAGLTGALEAAQTDRDNLLRTLDEANERAEEIRKEAAKEILREILGWGEYEPLYDNDGSGYVRIKHIKSEVAKYGVEVDE